MSAVDQLQTILTSSQLNDDAKREISVGMINNIKIFILALKLNFAIVKSIVNYSFAKKLVLEKKQLALIKKFIIK